MIYLEGQIRKYLSEMKEEIYNKPLVVDIVAKVSGPLQVGEICKRKEGKGKQSCHYVQCISRKLVRKLQTIIINLW